MNQQIGTPLTMNDVTPPVTRGVIIPTSVKVVAEDSSGHETELVTVKISGLTGDYFYSVQDFTLVGSDGVSYPPTIGQGPSNAATSTVGTGELRVGQTVTGLLAFTVPLGGGQLEYLDSRSNSPAGWVVPK